LQEGVELCQVSHVCLLLTLQDKHGCLKLLLVVGPGRCVAGWDGSDASGSLGVIDGNAADACSVRRQQHTGPLGLLHKQLKGSYLLELCCCT
jgi:hypothetical protein